MEARGAAHEMNNRQTPSTCFTCFPDLPLELHRHIWKFAALALPQESRIQCIALDPAKSLTVNNSYGRQLIRGSRFFKKCKADPLCKILIHNGCPVPSLVVVCTESKKIACEVLGLALWPSAKIEEVEGSGGLVELVSNRKSVVVNKARDIFYFGGSCSFNLFGAGSHSFCFLEVIDQLSDEKSLGKK